MARCVAKHLLITTLAISTSGLELRGCHLRAYQDGIGSSVIQIVRLSRRRKPASYSA